MTARSITAPPPLTGERVVVRGFTEDDVPALHAAIKASGAHLAPWFPWPPLHETPEQTRDYVQHTIERREAGPDFGLGIFRRADGRFLGGTGLHVRDAAVPSFEIGYWIRADAEGQGYVTETVRLLTRQAFEAMDAQRVMIRCNARNQRSRAVAERCGYCYEGCLRHEHRDTSGNLADMLMFSLIPSEYATLAWREHL